MEAEKIYIDEDPNLTLEHERCPDCAKKGENFNLRYMYLNLEEAVYKCSSPNCMFPYQNFKFKNYTDQTVYRYRFVSSESNKNQSEANVDASWIDSLPISPMKREDTSTKIEPLSSTFDMQPSQAFTEAMDQLQVELNDILASHCSEIENSEPKTAVSMSPVKSAVHVQKASPVKTEKPRKLSKCYEFIRQKSGVDLAVSDLNQSASSFKVPTQPVKESAITYKKNSQSHKKHRSGRSSKRSSNPFPLPTKSSSTKEPKIEKISDSERTQAISFLSHVEDFNKSQRKAIEPANTTDAIPFTIEISPQWNVSEEHQPHNFQIKVEGNQFSYYGDL